MQIYKVLLETKTHFSALSHNQTVFSGTKWSTIEINLPFITIIYKAHDQWEGGIQGPRWKKIAREDF